MDVSANNFSLRTEMEEWREVIESDRRMLQKTMFVAKVAFELPWGRLAGKSWGSDAGSFL